MAETVSRSGLYGVASVEEAMIRMVTGMELGLSMMQSLRGVYVMEAKGKKQPGLYADMMVGICKSRNDVCEYFRLVESTGTKATYETMRKGEPNPVSISFTIEQARAAGLTNRSDAWKSFPEAMLRARASTALARAVYPDVLNGLYSVEEIQDMGGALPEAPSFAQQMQPPPPPQLIEQLQASVELNDKRAKCHEELRAVLEMARDEQSLESAKELMKDAARDKLLTKSQFDDLVLLGQARKASLIRRGIEKPADNAIGGDIA
jgi:hypothetical protein